LKSPPQATIVGGRGSINDLRLRVVACRLQSSAIRQTIRDAAGHAAEPWACDVCPEGTMLTRLAASAFLMGLVASAPAAADPIVFTFEGRVTSGYVGLLDTLGIAVGESVQFSIVVAPTPADINNTTIPYTQIAVLGSLLTIGDYTMHGGPGRTQVFNGSAYPSIGYDQFTAYSYWWDAPAFAFAGRSLLPNMAHLTLQDNWGAAFQSGAFPVTAPDPNAFGTQRLQLSYGWVDSPNSGVAVTIDLDRSLTNAVDVPEPATLLLMLTGAIGLGSRCRRRIRARM
jgi:hypothetical protein